MGLHMQAATNLYVSFSIKVSESYGNCGKKVTGLNFFLNQLSHVFQKMGVALK